MMLKEYRVDYWQKYWGQLLHDSYIMFAHDYDEALRNASTLCQDDHVTDVSVTEEADYAD